MHLPADVVPMRAPSVKGAGIEVLAAASWLFYEQGVQATSVDAIADRAGVTKRTVYQHFRSKDVLVADYLRSRAHEWQARLTDGLQRDASDPLAVVYGAVGEWADRRRRGCAFVNAWAELGGREHPAADVVVEEKQWMRRLFTVLAAGEDATGSVLHLVYEGAQVCVSIQDDAAALEVALQTSRQLLASARTRDGGCGPGDPHHHVSTA